MSKLNYSVTDAKTLCSSEDAKEQFRGLVKAQWGEVDVRSETSEASVDFDKYIKMGELGLHYVVLVHTDEELVGYMSLFLTLSPHNGEHTVVTDSVYIKKEYRNSGVGSNLIKKAEEEAASRGCKYMLVSFKVDYPHMNITETNGFYPYETVYNKYIGG